MSPMKLLCRGFPVLFDLASFLGVMDTEEKLAQLEFQIAHQKDEIEDLFEINEFALAVCETLARGLEHVLHGTAPEERKSSTKHFR